MHDFHIWDHADRHTGHGALNMSRAKAYATPEPREQCAREAEQEEQKVLIKVRDEQRARAETTAEMKWKTAQAVRLKGLKGA